MVPGAQIAAGAESVLLFENIDLLNCQTSKVGNRR
jgi:hypothetical protein